MEELPVRTTSYSLMRSVPGTTERRSDDRHLTIFRVGTLISEGRRELCLVKNLSAGGALVRAFSSLAEERPVELEIRERQPLKATVSWVRGNDAGLEFHSPIDVVSLLTSAGGGPKPRMPRVEVSCRAMVRQGASARGALIRNISQGGLSVELPGTLTVGDAVTVTLPGMTPQLGLVRWSNAGLYGISFSTTLGLPALVQWLQEHGTSAQPNA